MNLVRKNKEKMNLLTTKRDPSTSLRLCKAIKEKMKGSREKQIEVLKNREKIRTNPLTEIDVKLVEGDMGGGDENFLDERVDSLENSEVEKLGALLV